VHRRRSGHRRAVRKSLSARVNPRFARTRSNVARAEAAYPSLSD
jgi:hypothetical protein